MKKTSSGGILSGPEIHEYIKSGRIQVSPFNPKHLNPASLDLTLGDEVVEYLIDGVIDVRKPPEVRRRKIGPEGFVIQAHSTYLMHTAERLCAWDTVPVIDGKALSLDTEVPTPSGWARMGDLHIGDLVYGADGHPTKIIRSTEVLLGRPCFQVIFMDDTKVIADASHQWFVYPVDAKPGIRTTAQMAARKWRQGTLFRIPAVAIKGHNRRLPIAPYTLGAWLGDGTSTSAHITIHDQDEQILEEIRRDGYTVEPRAKPRGCTTYIIDRKPHVRGKFGQFMSDNGSLQAKLRKLGLLGNKHIPDNYKKASYLQRWDLLQGLMDTDGTVHRDDQASITLSSKILFDDVEELCRSLGLVTYRDERPAKIKGREVGVAYRITWRATPELFRLDRKRLRVRTTTRWLKDARHPFRGIRSIKPVDSVPVRCIEVAAPDGLFLATRSFIPTHNSSLGRLFVSVHQTAGYLDPGFNGQATLEVTSYHSVRVYPGMRFCQVRFHPIVGQVAFYEGHYQKDMAEGAVPSMVHKQMEELESRRIEK